jgi:hypothetical protein
MRKLIICLLLLVVAIPVFAQESDMAHMRVAHFSIDAGPVDVYVNGEAVLTNMSYPDVSNWIAQPAGTYSVAVAPAETSLEEAVIGPLDIELAADDWITVAAIGLAGNNTLTAQVLVEDFSPMNGGEARVSMFHAAASLPPVNIVAGEATLVTQLGYPGTYGPESDGFDTTDVVAQVYDFEIQDENGETLADIGNLNLGQNRNYFIAVIGTGITPQFTVVTSDLEALMAEPEPEVDLSQLDLGTGTLYVRVGHFSPGTQAVDVYINGALSDIQGLEFMGLTDWVEMDAGVYTVAIAPAGTSLEEAVIEKDVPLATDTVITMAAIGALSTENLDIALIEEDYSATAPSMTRLSIFHAVPDAPLMSLVANGTTLIQGLGYPGYFEGEGDGFATVDVVAQEYALSVTLDDGTEVADLGTLLLGQGRNYFIVVGGLANDPLYLIERTDIGDLAK